MGRQVHYELFVRRGASPSWSLIDALDVRADALDAAKAQMASGYVTGVKVVREAYDDATGAFHGLTIFEEGHRKVKRSRAEEEAPPSLPA